MEIINLCISKEDSIRKCIKRLDETAKKVLLVTEYERLIGVVTDGDIRRWILKNGDLNEAVSAIMNTHFIALSYKNINKAKKIFSEKKLVAIPIIDEAGIPVEMIFWNDLFKKEKRFIKKVNVPVVIMAGGKGTRLYPYTKIIPKPLIPIGDIPIVERIINRFNEFGCDQFYLTVNYKKDMIKSYFNEIEKKYELIYVDEDKPLGTGGSLHLLKGKLQESFFVSNCDILIDANYADIMTYHKEKNNKITVVTSLKHYTVPYGVIDLNEEGTVKKTKEKPEFNFLVNTGMYILEPELLEMIPENEFYHLTQLIDICIEQGVKVGTYPVSEQAWLDMGELKEMERMNERLEE